MTMFIDKIKESAKAFGTLLTGIIAAILAFGVDEPLAHYLAIVVVIIGAIVTWATPNQDTPDQARVKAAGVEALALENHTYASLGGVDYPDDPTDADSGTPETTRLYESGEAPAYDVTNPPADLASPKGTASNTDAKDPVSGNDNV